MEIAFDRHVTPPDATTPTGRSPPGERAVETVKRSSRGGLTSKIHAVVDTNGLPVRLGLTAGETHDNR
jgi:hypothetical protein